MVFSVLVSGTDNRTYHRDLRTALRDRQSCEEKADEDDDQVCMCVPAG